MNYDLAKKLKEAGFPQRNVYPCEICGGKTDCAITRHENAKPAYQPSFGVLIEAVKNHPMNRKDVGLYANHDEYVAWARKTNLDEGGDGDRDIRGATPEDAMALLWLALQGGSAPQE